MTNHNTATRTQRPRRSRLREVGLLHVLLTILAACHFRVAWGHDDDDDECGADATTPEEVAKLQAIIEQQEQQQQQQQPSLRASSLQQQQASTTTTTTIAIPVFFHIILQSDGQTHTTGLITDDHVTETIRLLNEAYEETTPFYFYLKEPSPQRTINYSWYSSKCNKENDSAFKAPLRQGGSDALNIYVCDSTLSGYLGWATYPWRLSDDRVDPLQDGAVISYKAVYGAKPEFVRHTLTHEVGHWLGLWHTYENGCDGNGDGVEDTPSHLQSKTNCTLPNQDTCVDALYTTYANFDKGLDPRNNYMDTNNEECRSEFTPGQTRRMLTMFRSFRMKNQTDPNYVPPTAAAPGATSSSSSTTDNLGRSDCTPAGGVCNVVGDCCQANAQPLICAESVCVADQKMDLDADADKDDNARLFDQQGREQDRGGVRRRLQQGRQRGRRHRRELKGSSFIERVKK